MPADIGTVEDRFYTIPQLPLHNGQVMPQARIAYETYGRLAPGGRNAVLLTHGYTGSHHFAGRNPANNNQPGSWDGLVGPGKAIDTDRLFVVASNMLGSSFGSTNGASLNPATGEPYGPDFPAIAVRDIVAAQKALLDHLGVRHLLAVAGPSYGGYQAFQWAVQYPDMVDAIVPVVSAPRAQNAERRLAELLARLESDPEWNGGRYYGRGGPRRAQAEEWARVFDANSLVILRRATIGFDTVKEFDRIRARVLYVLCRTDTLFPPAFAAEVMPALAAAGVEARYFEIDSEMGHLASGPEHAKWSPVLREFLAPLMAQLG